MLQIGGFVMNKGVITQNVNSQKNILKANSLELKASEASTASDLIIEENTIYEIDEDCMNCLNKEKNSN